MSGSFAQGTFLLTGLAHLAFCLSSTVFAGWLPRPTRSPCFWWCDFRRTSGTTQPSDHFQSTTSRFTCAYGVASLGAIRGLWKFSWGHVLIFRTVPSANTLIRWVNENAFAPIVRARPCPTFGRPVHLGVAPIDYGPVFLLMPSGFPEQRLQVHLVCIQLRLRARIGLSIPLFYSAGK